jgi:hypothetical protein
MKKCNMRVRILGKAMGKVKLLWFIIKYNYIPAPDIHSQYQEYVGWNLND